MADNQNIFLFRNCYTNGVAGGDVHSTGVYSWLKNEFPNLQVTCVLPLNDGQIHAYPKLNKLNIVAYNEILKTNNVPLSYFVRTIRSIFGVKLSKVNGAIYVASSHFAPDVIPALIQSLHSRRSIRAVYIHHIISDMNRSKSIKNTFAILQEKFTFYIIKKYYSKIIVVNNEVKKRLLEKGFKDNKILVSSNFIDTTFESNKYVEFNEKTYDFVFCGRLMNQKGVYDFLKIIEGISIKRPTSAVMIGDGPERDLLKSIISKNNLPIKLTGYVSDKVKFDYLKSARIMIFPSIEEGWGIAVAESLACGTPVIAYHLPVYDEVFEKSITTVAIGEYDKLQSVVESKYTEYSASRSKYISIQEKGKNYIGKYRIQTVALAQYSFLKQGL